MLRLRPSLKLRAAAIFTAVYAVVFLAGFVLLAWQSLAVGGESHHAGPNIALRFAADELRLAGGRMEFPVQGRFLRLAAENPALWLLARTPDGRHAFGPVPEAAAAWFDAYAGAVEIARLHVPGLQRPLSDTSALRRGSVVLAAGGVDPATISLGDVFQYTLREGLMPILLAFGLIGLIGMLVALPLLGAALKPVTADAAAIRADNPDRRIGEHSVPRELLPLVRSFNAALERLAQELLRRRRFVADVAHELKTPLAIMSLQVDSLPGGERKTELQRVTMRMSQLVAQMLDVERLSLSGRQRLDVDLCALAREVVADMAPMAVASGYELSVDAPAQPVMVSGDPHALGRAIANLIGNGVAHAGGRGEIQVRVSPERTLDVIDAGPGVPMQLRDDLFEPFCRERWDRDGCGMGLHLTREIMRAHGGDAQLLDSVRGAAFRLLFPR